MYMDDIKLPSDTRLKNKLLRVVEEFSNDIKTKFVLEKCKTNNLKKGLWHESEDLKLIEETGGGSISAMSGHESCSQRTEQIIRPDIARLKKNRL